MNSTGLKVCDNTKTVVESNGRFIKVVSEIMDKSWEETGNGKIVYSNTCFGTNRAELLFGQLLIVVIRNNAVETDIGDEEILIDDVTVKLLNGTKIAKDGDKIAVPIQNDEQAVFVKKGNVVLLEVG